MIILIISAFLFLIYIDLIPLYRQKYWRDFWVNSVITLLSFIIAILLNFGVKIPSPAVPIKNVIKVIIGK